MYNMKYPRAYSAVNLSSCFIYIDHVFHIYNALILSFLSYIEIELKFVLQFHKSLYVQDVQTWK